MLARLREADYPAEDELVQAALQRLEGVKGGGKRKANAARKWWGESGDREQRRADREQQGSVKEQRLEYAAYIADLAGQLEAATNGQAVTARERSAQATGRGMSLERILTSNPNTMRARLSDEALEFLGSNPPLPFDAWRYANLGARDQRAVASWQARTGSYFSEWG